MLRLLHCLMVMSLIASAAYVYDIKYRATGEAQQAQRLRNEIRKERDLIASARAQWVRLSSPDRIQALAARHLKMKPIDASRFGTIASLPERPKLADPIGDILEALPQVEANAPAAPDETPTGSVQPQ